MSKKSVSSKIKKPLASKKEAKNKIDVKAIAKAAAARKKEADKAAAEAIKAKALAEKQKRGEIILLAAEEGRAATQMVTGDHYLNGLQKALGKDYVVDATSLTLAEGVKPTEKSLTKLIAGLAGATEGLRKAEGSTTFALGDACLIAKQEFPDQADEIISQAANISGREKHTIQQAARVAEFFPKEKRIEGLTFTHFQELMNYSKEKGTDKLKITEAAQQKLLSEAFTVEGVPITKADGEDIEARKEPISVREFRERLQEKVGKTPTSKKSSKPSKGKDVDPDEHLFLYVDSNGGVKYTKGLNLEVCRKDECLVIDATDLTVLNAKGSIQFSITELEVEEPENVVEMPKEDKRLNKEAPKAPKKKVAGLPD